MSFLARSLAFAAAFSLAASPALALEVVGRIDELVPAAYHTPPDAQQMEARKLDPIVRNETLTTTDAGGLLVTFADGSELTLGANSQAVIDEFVYPGPGQGNATIELISGVFRFVSGQMDEAGVQIETPTASIGIRGTTIYTAVSPTVTIQITQEGRSWMKSRTTGKTVEIEAGSAVSVDGAGNFSDTVPFGASVDQSGYENPEVMLGIVPADDSTVPREIDMLPSRRASGVGGRIKFALAQPTDMIIQDQNSQQAYLAGFLLWEQGYNPDLLNAVNVARSRATGVMTRRTSAIGSAAGRATRAARPRDRSNDIIVGVLVSTTPTAATDWIVTQGNQEIHFAQGASFGSIVSPAGGDIVSLNNSGASQTTMVKTFTLGPGQRLFSLAGLAAFVTTEFPEYVDGGYNDDASIILRTESGQVIDISELFSADVDTALFSPTSVANSPISDPTPGDGAGITSWRTFLTRLRVAPGSNITIEVRVRNVTDTAFPSAVLLNNIIGAGSR
jgi:hypothetical protein